MSPRVKTFMRAAVCGMAFFPQMVRADGVADERLDPPAVAYAEDALVAASDIGGGPDGQVSAQLAAEMKYVMQPAPVTQPEEPVQATATAAPSTAGAFGGFVDLSTLSPERAAAASTSASDVVSGAESEVRNTADTSDLLVRSLSTTGLYVHSRNPISNDLRIRGFRFSQIRNHVHGAFWTPIRPDFDSPLSKIDSSLIKDIVVVKGPYSVRQGPGFAFIDIELQDTERHEGGWGWSGRSAAIFDTNGDQFNFRQSFSGGDETQGIRVGYAERGGVDYESGDGFLVASGYHSHDWDLAYGWDVGPDSQLEFMYQRVDQTDVELPAQYFDVDYLVADGFSVRYTEECLGWADRFQVDTWWNRSRFAGNANNQSKQGVGGVGGAPAFPLLIGNGNIGDERSAGVRTAISWGCVDCGMVTLGADYTFVDQEYIETADRYFGFFGLPRSVADNPGIFADTTLPLSSRTTVKAGARVDWAGVNTVPGTLAQNAMDDQNYTLGAGYITSEYELTDVWKLNAGYGYAERAPTPTDLYALTFLELLQPGGDLDFRGSLRGSNPAALDKERLSQFDVGASYEYCYVRGGINLFFGWVDDYITYQYNGGVMDTVNTDAQLAGGEWFTEVDLTEDWTGFATISYVQAKDEVRNEPLWGIPPLDSRVGLRFQRPDWGFEFAARIVDNQDRIARAIFTDGIMSASLGEQVTPGFTSLDIRGFYAINDVWRLVGGVENIGDRNYQEHLDARRDLSYGTPGGVFRPGVNAYFGLIGTY
ncbi:MAG: TonB-dependent receptor [Pirellulales bacterium]